MAIEGGGYELLPDKDYSSNDLREKVETTANMRAKYTRKYFEITGKSLEEFVQHLSKAPWEIHIDPQDDKSLTLGIFDFQQKMGFDRKLFNKGCDGICGPYTFKEYKKSQLFSDNQTERNQLKKDIFKKSIQPEEESLGEAKVVSDQIIKPIEIINEDERDGSVEDISVKREDEVVYRKNAEKLKLIDQEYPVFVKLCKKIQQMVELGRVEDFILFQSMKDKKRGDELMKHIFKFKNEELIISKALLKRSDVLMKIFQAVKAGKFSLPDQDLKIRLEKDEHLEPHVIKDFMEGYDKVYVYIHTKVLSQIGKAIERGEIVTLDDFINFFNKLLGKTTLKMPESIRHTLELPFMRHSIRFSLMLDQNGKMTLNNINILNLAEDIILSEEFLVNSPHIGFVQNLNKIKEQAQHLIDSGFEEIRKIIQESTSDISITDKKLFFSSDLINRFNVIINNKLRDTNMSTFDYVTQRFPINIQGIKYEFSFNIYPAGYCYIQYREVKS